MIRAQLAQLAVGDKKGAPFGYGIIDPWKAEISSRTRTHGQSIPAMIDPQIGNLGGGGTVNMGANDQASVHIPTDARHVCATG